MTTFSEAYRTFGCDVERIALVLKHIQPWMIDRLINRAMNLRAAERELRESRQRLPA